MSGIMDLFGKSPFQPLVNHLNEVMICSKLMGECMTAFTEQQFDEVGRYSVLISDAEERADEVKREIRLNLAKGLFLPVNRGDLQVYLSEQDRVADRIKALGIVLSLRQTIVPDEIKEDLLLLTERVQAVVNQLPDLLDGFNELLEMSFSIKSTMCAEVVGKLHELGNLTNEGDLQMRRRLYNLEDKLSYGAFFHLMQIIRLLERISDHAENCGDRMTVVVSRS